MSALQWSDDLALDLPAMDQTHIEFVELLSAVEQAGDAQLLAAWDALVAHTEQHFGQEDDWMQATRFAAGNCHSTQHRVVLQVMQEGARLGRGGRLDIVRQMAAELVIWFPQHAQSMDASLAHHLRHVAFDPATGQVHRPEHLPERALHGCGSQAC
ncbi:hemerythrin domain-containing protein [Roseateles toxinivorans]|uniref:Hemerythrin-like metal-binding protein n=1 Tax=Roseateles toxinivorans TaxID=270368 RepID=A0A4R6QIG5_9BURK|nr:hemerythrin domain-containing protein [Roseateles toxinivorans]TDP63144.1 hemerythrin-like metal-binding protein [Roseateles toxinivorans]